MLVDTLMREGAELKPLRASQSLSQTSLALVMMRFLVKEQL